VNVERCVDEAEVGDIDVSQFADALLVIALLEDVRAADR
jgi:hypothetical protein